MKLYKFHVDEFCAGLVCERVAISSIFPAITGNFVGAANPTGRQYDCFRAENFESTALPLVSKGAYHAVAVFEQRKNGVLHVHIDPLMNAVILQRADHFQAGAIAYVREPRIFMSAKMPLQNSAVFGAIENSAPRFKLAHSIGCLLGVQLGHAPLIYVLAAAHRISKMHLPIVAFIDIGQRRSDSALGHYRMRLA